MTSNARRNFQRNLNHLLAINKMSQVDLQKELGVSTATTSDWCAGKKIPKMDRVEEIANLFGVTTSEMLADNLAGEHFYFSKETRDIADEISENKELRLLFKATKDVNAGDLKMITELLKSLKRKERGDDGL